MKLLYPQDVIMKRIRELGAEISRDYEGKQILAIGLLKGSVMLLAHLLPYIRGKVEIDFMTISSYKHGTKSKDFKFIQDLDSEVKGRDILIVEDIIDSGRTMSFTLAHLEALGAASIETVVLINKTKHRKYEIKPAKYIGFEYNEDPFLIGFGFDFDGLYRNLPDVYQMDEGDDVKLANE